MTTAPLDRQNVIRLLKTYGEAWVEQEPDKILTIFTKDAKYHERVFKKPFVGHKGIKAYWTEKVVKEQSNIKFKLLNVYIAGDTVIAEWDASFDSNIEKAHIKIKEVAILEMRGGKIADLREYWQSEKKSLF
jgi:ketosteroid isomerase-like protein